MDNEELCAWLRANSSGIYRPAAEAADEIERLETALGSYEEVWRLTELENQRLKGSLKPNVEISGGRSASA